MFILLILPVVALCETVVDVQCDEGKHDFGGNNCYWTTAQGGTTSFFGGRRDCGIEGGYLAMIDIEAENNRIKDILRSNNIPNAWFGLKDSIGKGFFNYKENIDTFYINWSDYSPEYYFYQRHCTAVNQDETWDVAQCEDNEYGVICETYDANNNWIPVKRFGKKYYIRLPVKYNYPDAVEKCREKRATVLSLSSPVEAAFVSQSVKSYGRAWISYTDLRLGDHWEQYNFEWDAKYNGTMSTRDDNPAGKCMAINQDGEWFRSDCNAHRYFLCSIPKLSE